MHTYVCMYVYACVWVSQHTTVHKAGYVNGDIIAIHTFQATLT